MRKTTEGLVVLVLLTASARGALADSPELSSWLLNTTGRTGYNGAPLLPNGHVTIGETVIIYTPTSPGRVPESVMVARVSSSQIELTWNVSCTSAGASDYGIFEGTIGSWYGHSALTCADTSHDLKETVTTSAGDHYYLIVPYGTGREGSYGTASNGAEIPLGGPSFCAPSSEPASCP